MTSSSRAPAASQAAPILELDDPIGVVSIYVDADPTLSAGSRPAWETPVRDGLRRLLRDAQSWPRADRVALQRRVDELEPELEAFLDRTGPSRGRALFTTVAGGETHRVDLRTPVATAVVFGRRAIVVPLLAALQRGRAAGVADVGRERLVLSEWERGELRELETVDIAPSEERGRGRPATNPAVPQPFPERDAFETAAGSRILARVREAGARLADEAAARGWDMIVADGDPRLLGALAAGLGRTAAELVRSPQPFAATSTLERAHRITATLHDRRAAAAARLLERLDDTGAATRDRAVVERAVVEGRVEHLLLAEAAADEELLRGAVETGAGVTILDVPSTEVGSGGVAALLRW